MCSIDRYLKGFVVWLFWGMVAMVALLSVVTNLHAGWLFGRSAPQGAVCNGPNCFLPARPPAAVPIPAGTPLPAPIVAPPKNLAPPPPYVPPGGVFPTGVVGDKLSAIEPKYHHNGHEVGKNVAYQALGGQSLIDDAAKPYIAVVDADAKRRGDVVAKLKADLGDKAKFWDGPPDDWSFATGHKTDGHPTIYAQLPTGEVKHRQDEIADGIDVAVGAVRKAFPDYNPVKDPDLRKPAPPPGGGGLDLTNIRNQIALALAAFVAGLIALLKGKQPAAA